MVPLDEWWYNRFVSSVFFNNQNVRVAATQTSWSVFGHHIFDRSPNSIGISIIAGLVIFASRAADGCSSCQISLTDQYVNFDMRTWCFLKKKRKPWFEKWYSKYGNLFGLSVIRRNGFEWNYLLGNAEAAWRDHITKRRILWHNRQSIWRWSPCLECAAWVVLHSLIVSDLARRAWCLIDIDCCCLKRFDRLCHQLQTGGSDLEIDIFYIPNPLRTKQISS